MCRIWNKVCDVFWIWALTVAVTSGIGDREYGEACEPIKTLEVLDNYGSHQQQHSQRQPYSGYVDENRPYTGDQYTGQVHRNGHGNRHYYPRERNDQEQAELERRYAQLAREVNDTRRCRSERGLRCDPYTRTCKCFDLAGAAWSYDRNRCEFQLIGTFCSPKITEFAQYCTEYAECTCNWDHWDRRRWYPCDRPPLMDHHGFPGMHVHDTNNGRCLCLPGYTPHRDNSGCWYSGAEVNDLRFLPLLIYLAVLKFVQSWWSLDL